MPSEFTDAARELGFDFDDSTLERFSRYRDAIAGAAGRFSLTAVREPGAIERRHFLESLALGRLLAGQGLVPDRARVLDIGSGAGLPGVPLKLAWPSLRLSLLDSNGKRCQFLRDCVRDLKLEGVEVLEGRAEDFGRDEGHRAAYDLVVARAVAPLPVLVEYALPFLRSGGALAAIKGSAAVRELFEAQRALDELGGHLAATLELQPPEGMAQSVLVVRKVRQTPERYPRRAGIPSKRPLA